MNKNYKKYYTNAVIKGLILPLDFIEMVKYFYEKTFGTKTEYISDFVRVKK